MREELCQAANEGLIALWRAEYPYDLDTGNFHESILQMLADVLACGTISVPSELFLLIARIDVALPAPPGARQVTSSVTARHILDDLIA